MKPANAKFHGDAAALAMQEFDDVASCQWAAEQAQKLKHSDGVSAVCVPKSSNKADK